MVSKTVLILTFVGACMAIPVENIRPPVAALKSRSLVSPDPGLLPGEQIPEEVKPDEIDLKTDASRWWRRSYYPTYPIYRRYYNYPSVYSYYSPSYSYWNPYW